MEKKFKVAIIGVGRAGSGLHLPACLDIANANGSIAEVAICDVSQERVDKIANEFNVEKRYTDVDAILRNEKPDITIVCNPPEFHKMTLEKCLKVGSHVILEKPSAPSVEDIEEMVRIAGNYPDLKVMVNQNYRWFKDSVAVMNIIDEGFIGEPYWMEIRSLMRNVMSFEDPTYSRWLSRSKHKWLLEQGVHWIDLFNFYLGEEPSQVYTRIPSENVTENDGLSIVNINYENGKCGLLVQNYVTKIVGSSYIARIEGSEGTVVARWNVDMTDSFVEAYSTKINSKMVPDLEEFPAGKWTESNKFFSGQQQKVIKYFIECIKQNKEPIPNLKEDIKTIRILFAAYKSAAEHKIVDITEQERNRQGK